MKRHHTSSAIAAVTAGAALLAMLADPALAQEKSKESIPLIPAGFDTALAAKMLFICGGGSGGTTTGPVRFKMTVTNAEPLQPVTVVVNGMPEATVEATSSGKARFTFGSNGAPGLPMDFDPRDSTVEVEDSGGTQLTNETEDGSNPPGTRIDERVSLAATGAVPAASGRARLRERNGVRDFDVEVEDLPDASYTLIVAGVERGTIVVAGGRGGIEFSDGGDDPDEFPLDFDPLAALVQVADGSTIVLSATMLADAPGVSVCTPSEASTELTSSGADPDASGDARFRVKDDCDREFRVEIEDLPVGSYDVIVDGVLRGSIGVVDLGLGETEGEIEFDTDADDPDEVLLDFDPVGKTVEIVQGATLFLSSTVGEPSPGTCSIVDDEPDFTNTGADPDADGKARFRQEDDCDRDFRVEAEDLAIGSYEVVVGGVVRGTLDVAAVTGGTQGELEFDSDPGEPGKLLLDFDPRAQLVEVRQGATVYLSVTMGS